MPTVFEQIFGNGQGGAQGLLGNPAFMVGSGLLSNQSNPWGGAIQGLAAAQGYKLSESKMKKDAEKEARQAELQAMQMEQLKQAQERQKYTQAILASASSQNPALLQDPTFQSQLRQKAAAYGDPAALEQGGLLAPLGKNERTNIEKMLIAAGVPEGSPQWNESIMTYALKPKSSVTVNNGLIKPPAGYRFDPNDPTAVIPLTGGPADPAVSKEGREGAGNISRIDTSLNNYRAALETYGTQIVPTAEKKVLAASHKDLLLEMKELYKLGVLNGPDYEIMLDVIEDPTAVWTKAQGYDRQDLLKQLDAVVVPKLEAAKKLYEQQYGRQFSAPGAMGSSGTPEAGKPRLKYNPTTGQFE